MSMSGWGGGEHEMGSPPRTVAAGGVGEIDDGRLRVAAVAAAAKDEIDE